MNCLIVSAKISDVEWLRNVLSSIQIAAQHCHTRDIETQEASHLLESRYSCVFLFQDTIEENFLDTLNQLRLIDDEIALFVIRNHGANVDVRAVRLGADHVLIRTAITKASLPHIIHEGLQHAAARVEVAKMELELRSTALGIMTEDMWSEIQMPRGLEIEEIH